MTNNQIKKYMNDELDCLDKIIIENQIENDLLLKEGIAGLRMYKNKNKTTSLDDLENELNKKIDEICKKIN